MRSPRTAPVRPLVADSWARCTVRGVHADGLPPLCGAFADLDDPNVPYISPTVVTGKGTNMKYEPPGAPGSPVDVAPRYENFIGGKWLPPTTGRYTPNLCPATARPICEVPKSGPQDTELALDAAHAAKDTWGEVTTAQRAAVLNKVADAIDAHREELAVAESWENGKPVRETLAADIPLGVVGQIIPFNFPLLMAAWKLAPALAAGNCSVIKPASPTPWSILKLMEVVGDILPPGVLNVVNGPGAEIGKALATNKRIAKVAFTGETTTGRLIMRYASQNIIPVTLELGGKSPNIFFDDVAAADDDFLDKAVEGLVFYAFNKGEVCTAPSRALIQENIYEEFMARCLERIRAVRQGDPLDTDTMMGPQVSKQQIDKIASYVDIGLKEGAELLVGGHRADIGGPFTDGYFFEPTVLRGHNRMRVFQEEIFGPVLSVATFKDEAEALALANDTLYGLGAHPALGRPPRRAAHAQAERALPVPRHLR